ncbi:hypothetical protein VNO80_17673 [Phaseolus coccineus]|uniref:Uncharacterized protein n=1 Tax=Phaseolus coccineus TaxID=3886 RepID=A0AAN9MG78_PHACN
MEGPSHSTPTRIPPFNSITDNKTPPTQLASHHSHLDSIFLPLYPHSHRHPRHLPNKKDKRHTRSTVVGVVLSYTEPHSKDSGCHCKREEALRLESDTVSDSNASLWGLIIVRRSRPRTVW